MSEPQPTQEPTRQQIKERTATIVRRLGYVVFMGGGLLIFVPMLIGVGVGISENEIWDPVSGRSVHSTERGLDCEERARQMLIDAGRQERLTGTWSESFSAWVTRCQAEYPDIYDLLNTTRDELRNQ